ncbi:hypothetical protein ID260_005018 [Escherichia coli]|nr:hypothetical protein [Escherichia coli]
MKNQKTITKRVRVDSDLNDLIDALCNEKQINFSELVRGLILNELDKPSGHVKESKSGRKNRKKVTFLVDESDYNRLIAISDSKGCNLSTELRFRLASSLSDSCFDTIELNEICRARTDIARLGGLLKYATAKNLLLQDEVSKQALDEIEQLKKALLTIIKKASNRVC